MPSHTTTDHHGIPEAACDDVPTGHPTSDRHHSETAASPRGGNARAPKHSHATESAASQASHDESLADSFPASDPPAASTPGEGVKSGSPREKARG